MTGKGMGEGVGGDDSVVKVEVSALLWTFS
jgi:hypothetical protein